MSKLGWQKTLRYADDLTHAEFRVLTVISTYTDESMGNAFPGFSQIVGASCVSGSTAKAAIKSLIEKGWLVLIEEGGNQYWKGKANVYAVATPTSPKGVAHRPPSGGGKGGTQAPPSTARKGADEHNQGDRSSVEGGQPLPVEGGYSVPPHQILTPDPSIRSSHQASSRASNVRTREKPQNPNSFVIDELFGSRQQRDDTTLEVIEAEVVPDPDEGFGVPDASGNSRTELTDVEWFRQTSLVPTDTEVERFRELRAEGRTKFSAHQLIAAERPTSSASRSPGRTPRSLRQAW